MRLSRLQPTTVLGQTFLALLLPSSKMKDPPVSFRAQRGICFHPKVYQPQKQIPRLSLGMTRL